MDKTWQKNLAAFLGLLTAIFGVIAYFHPLTPEAPLPPRPVNLDARLQVEREMIFKFVNLRTASAEIKLDDLKGSIQDFKTEMRESFKKLDDRIFEMQRRHAAVSQTSDGS